jgi:hypothetical protein
MMQTLAPNTAGIDLDDTGIRHGQPCSLRWFYAHIVEEWPATTVTPTSSENRRWFGRLVTERASHIAGSAACVRT